MREMHAEMKSQRLGADVFGMVMACSELPLLTGEDTQAYLFENAIVVVDPNSAGRGGGCRGGSYAGGITVGDKPNILFRTKICICI